MTKTITISDAVYAELVKLTEELTKMGGGAAFSEEFTIMTCIMNFRDSLKRWNFRRQAEKMLREIAIKKAADNIKVFRE